IMLNNMLGEEDLNPRGMGSWPLGKRMTSMMAPAAIHLPSGDLAIVGSGGSNRIRSAVALVLTQIARGLELEAAVVAPRVHAEDEAVWVELAGREQPAAIRERLAAAFPAVRGFAERAFFFGGVHVAALDGRGGLAGVGDQRRGGVADIVD
ncbi:MAG: gamma-glutamyltransferase, partial [Myxococcales bacterium]|nr:gamma-glutamyltransferase [Myxococcales bacterium]